MFDLETFSQRISRLRKVQNVSLETIARLAGVSAMSVSNWERGDSRPLPDKMENLAKALNTTVEYLLQTLPKPKKARDINIRAEKPKPELTIEELLAQTSLNIVKLTGLPAEAISLRLEIDYLYKGN